MFPLATKGGGVCMAFPDVCKVPAPPAPPIPMPFPNTGQCANAMNASLVVMVENKPVLHKMSEIPASQGDEAGVAGGVVSGVNMQKVAFMTASTKVLIEGSPAVMWMGTTGHNGASANAPMGQQLVPSQMAVLALG